MEPTATLARWGNGMGVLIPKAARDRLGLELCDKVRFEESGDGGVELVPEKQPWTLSSLMAGYDGPRQEFIDPGTSVGREVW